MMKETKNKPGRIDRELVGEPITVGERTIQPVARLTGWAGGTDGAQSSGGAAWLSVRPVEVIVREADGSESRVAITDPTAMAVRGIMKPALAVAGVCLAIIAGRTVACALRRRA